MENSFEDNFYDDDMTESGEEDDEDEEDNRNDPDWQRTPLIRKRRIVSALYWKFGNFITVWAISEEKVVGSFSRRLGRVQ